MKSPKNDSGFQGNIVRTKNKGWGSHKKNTPTKVEVFTTEFCGS
jgi:hypothetical protein